MLINEVVFKKQGNLKYSPLEVNGLQHLVDIIKIKSSEYWKLYQDTGLVLYRGFHSGYTDINDKSYFYGSTINNRSLNMTPLSVAKKLDLKLKQNGFTALRNNSILCTGDEFQAKIYQHGIPWIIFPCQGSTMTWNVEHEDLPTSMGLDDDVLDWYESGEMPDNHELKGFWNDLYCPEPIPDFAEKYGFQKDGIVEAIKSGHEILIHGKYIAVSGNTWKEIQSNWSK